MDNVLIVSSADKSTDYFRQFLTKFGARNIVCVNSSQIARQTFLDKDFDLTLINSPLSDENGENLAIDITLRSESQVIMVVKSENIHNVSNKVEPYGVITVEKPINQTVFWTTVKVASICSLRTKTMRKQNSKLVKKIDDIKIIDRAKCILISNLNMLEQDAHKYIEKQAMDHRISKRDVALKILKTYEN